MGLRVLASLTLWQAARSYTSGENTIQSKINKGYASDDWGKVRYEWQTLYEITLDAPTMPSWSDRVVTGLSVAVLEHVGLSVARLLC